jgi:hypothetical protein
LVERKGDRIMTRNVGSVDRLVRLVAGVLIVGAGFGLHSWWGLLGFLPLATGLSGYCPLYRLLGFDTCGDGGCHA